MRIIKYWKPSRRQKRPTHFPIKILVIQLLKKCFQPSYLNIRLFFPLDEYTSVNIYKIIYSDVLLVYNIKLHLENKGVSIYLINSLK